MAFLFDGLFVPFVYVSRTVDLDVGVLKCFVEMFILRDVLITFVNFSFGNLALANEPSFQQN